MGSPDLQLPRGVLVVLLGDLDDGECVDHDELAHAIHLERFLWVEVGS